MVRDCLAPMAGIGRRIPIWVTENGVPSGSTSDAQQAAALGELVRAVHDYSGTFNITDYRWFNLRDSTSSPPATLVGPTFSTDGLLPVQLHGEAVVRHVPVVDRRVRRAPPGGSQLGWGSASRAGTGGAVYRRGYAAGTSPWA